MNPPATPDETTLSSMEDCRRGSADGGSVQKAPTTSTTVAATSAAANDSQWSFIDSDNGGVGDGAASSISTLCSQFEATLAANDCHLDGINAAGEDLATPSQDS